MKPKKEVTVFLIEDDEIDTMAIQRAFDKAKIANPIVIARDGLDALEKLERGEVERPYVILLDLNMPRMNGLEFLDKIRDDPDMHDSVVFVLTTSKAEEDKCAAYERNVAGYIVKENVGPGFLDAITMLDNYWRVVVLP